MLQFLTYFVKYGASQACYRYLGAKKMKLGDSNLDRINTLNSSIPIYSNIEYKNGHHTIGIIICFK